MAKTYLDIVKYMVEAKFSITGMVDKPDIIGAVFGQTEGLLGDELDLRELQKSGKIGRIEIDIQQQGNKSFGRLYLPASLDRIETCILAAAVESVDRVGPYEAIFSIEKVEDTRSEKRKKILNRAKELVRRLLTTEIPDSKELSEMVQSEVRTSEITAFGPEHLPAGPEVGKSPEVIIVEGRADVLNLLRNGISNSIAVGGASAPPKSIIGLCREKEVTVFLDGDRGGDLILRSLANVADIDFVARAPDGKEVEDLTRKEIIKSIRSKIPLDQYHNGMKLRMPDPQSRQEPREQAQLQRQERAAAENEAREKEDIIGEIEQYFEKSVSQKDGVPEAEKKEQGRSEGEDEGPLLQKIETEQLTKEASTQQVKPALESMVFTQLASGLDELSGTLRSRLYDSTGNVMREMPIRDLLQTVQETGGIFAIVLDGVITQRLVELSVQKGIKAIYGLRANPMPRKHSGIVLYTKEQGTQK